MIDKCLFTFELKNRQLKLSFLVAETKSLLLLELKLCKNLKLIKRNFIVKSKKRLILI